MSFGCQMILTFCSFILLATTSSRVVKGMSKLEKRDKSDKIGKSLGQLKLP